MRRSFLFDRIMYAVTVSWLFLRGIPFRPCYAISHANRCSPLISALILSLPDEARMMPVAIVFMDNAVFVTAPRTE